MPFIPISFVVALLLVILFGAVVMSGDDGVPRNRPFLALILLNAFQAFLSGLRWGYGIAEVMYIAPVGAAFVSPLVYCGVARLTGNNDAGSRYRLALHAFPAVVVIIIMSVETWRGAIDALLPAIFIGYAARLPLIAALRVRG